MSDDERLDRDGLAALQRRKLAAMLEEVLKGNSFYRAKLGAVPFDPARDPISVFPFTTRAELEADQVSHPPYGSNLTYPLERYCRLHQTSGSSGRAMRWLDTRQSWDWFRGLWRVI